MILCHFAITSWNHYTNQCWPMIYFTPMNKLQWHRDTIFWSPYIWNAKCCSFCSIRGMCKSGMHFWYYVYTCINTNVYTKDKLMYIHNNMFSYITSLTFTSYFSQPITPLRGSILKPPIQYPWPLLSWMFVLVDFAMPIKLTGEYIPYGCFVRKYNFCQSANTSDKRSTWRNISYGAWITNYPQMTHKGNMKKLVLWPTHYCIHGSKLCNTWLSYDMCVSIMAKAGIYIIHSTFFRCE